MKSRWLFLVVTLFLVGFFVTGLLGTSTAMTFIWPGYSILGLAGVFSIICLFRETHFRVPHFCFGAVFALLCYLLIRAADSPVAYFSREDAALLIVCFLCYSIFLTLFTEGRWRNAFLWTVVSLIGVNLILAMAQRLISPSIWLIPGYERTFTDRVGGLFNHPDHFAGFLALGIPLMLAMASFSKRGPYARTILVTLSIMSLAAIIASQSAIGMISAAVGIFTFGAISLFIIWPNLLPMVKTTLIGGFVALAVIGSTVVYVNRVGVSYHAKQQVLARDGEMALIPVWKSAAKQFLESPISGTGSRSFYFYSRYFRPAGDTGNLREAEFAHNEYLQMLGDYGIVGLVMILALLALHFGSGLRFIRAYSGFRPVNGPPVPQSDHLGLTMGAIGALTVIGTLCCFDFVMHLPLIATLAAILLAILACPDPMSTAHRKTKRNYLPGGSVLFINRATCFASGLAIAIFGVIFTQSEWQYEMARLSFQGDQRNYKHFRHLQFARRLDPKNPFVMSLSGHAHAAAVRSDMADAERVEALRKADEYFTASRVLYPQDIYSAIGHSAVLDALGRHDAAAERIAFARQWAPLYGNLMLAEAEHFLRIGDLASAEELYTSADKAPVLRDNRSIERGLQTIDDWRKMAATQNPGGTGSRTAETTIPLPDAKVKEVAVGAKAEKEDLRPKEEVKKEDAPKESP